jgi:hypothetical protein
MVSTSLQAPVSAHQALTLLVPERARTGGACLACLPRAGLLPVGVGVVLDAALSDLRVRRVELFLGDQEGVVLGGDAVHGDRGEVQRDAVAQADRDERAPLGADDQHAMSS